LRIAGRGIDNQNDSGWHRVPSLPFELAHAISVPNICLPPSPLRSDIGCVIFSIPAEASRDCRARKSTKVQWLEWELILSEVFLLIAIFKVSFHSIMIEETLTDSKYSVRHFTVFSSQKLELN
jgi:hypothetical protein